MPFERVVIDQNPGAVPLEKTLVDIEGTGKLDIVVGHDTANGGVGGIEWYQNPRSGILTDHWNEYTIAKPGGSAYEDMVSYPLDGNGINDIIASYNNQLVWFDNPRNHHIDPTTVSSWKMHVIGPDYGHEIVLGDFNGDGRIDIATNNHIYFQPADPTQPWLTISSSLYGGDAVTNPSTRSEVGTALFDSGSGLGAVDLLGTGPAPSHEIGWFENPRDHGGNAETGVWTFHPISSNIYSTNPTLGLSYAAMDVNHDGREDIITAQGESGNISGTIPGGMIWWQAPANRITGTWTPHTIDGSLEDVHKITLADVAGNGQEDIVFSEQEQSQQDRVGVLYPADNTGLNWSEEVISTESGHNQFPGDVDGDGNIDILNAPHGVYTGVSPIVLFVNEDPGTVKPKVTIQPRSQTVTVGSAVTFYGVVLGSGITYRWERNGHTIAGATTASYTLPSATTANSGDQYKLVATNANGVVSTHVATLTVNAAGTTTAKGPVISVGTHVDLTQPIGSLNRTVTFTDTAAGPYTATVNYGDGSTSQKLSLGSSKSIVLKHTYSTAVAGHYSVKIKISDGTNSTTASLAVYTIDSPPHRLTLSSVAVKGSTFTASASYVDAGAGHGDRFTVTTDYGDGSPEQITTTTGRSVALKHTYATAGIYTVTTTVADRSGLSATTTAAATIGSPTTTSSFLSDQTITDQGDDFDDGTGVFYRDYSAGGSSTARPALDLDGSLFAKGFGVQATAHMDSDLDFTLGGHGSTFRADIGLDAAASATSAVDFLVFADGVQIYGSGRVTKRTAPKSIDLNVKNVNTLELMVINRNGDASSNFADWAGARVIS